MDSVRLSGLSMKYQRFTLSGFEDMGIRKFEFVAKTHFLHALSLLKLSGHRELLFFDFKH